MTLARILVGVASWLLVMSPNAQPADAAHDSTTRYTLEAYSNNCQYRAEADCVNVAVTIGFESATGQGRWCVSTQDNRVAAPPAAAGCVSTGKIQIDGRTLAVPAMTVPSVLATDCPPGDACSQELVDVTASATFSRTGKAVGYTSAEETIAGRCRTRTVTTVSRVDVVGTITVDGSMYALPGSDPLAHHRSATLVRETIRVTSNCD